MSPKTPNTTTGISLPPTETLSAPRHPAVYRIGSSHRGMETHMLFEAGHGTTLDLIYARGVPGDASPDTTFVDRKQCTLIIVEIGLCMDLGCDIKFEKKTEKYSLLLAALGR